MLLREFITSMGACGKFSWWLLVADCSLANFFDRVLTVSQDVHRRWIQKNQTGLISKGGERVDKETRR